MKYTNSAVGLLKRQYRSVLKKCFLINLGLFALGMISATPVRAEVDVVNLLNNPQFHYSIWSPDDYSVIDPDPVNSPIVWQKISATEAENYTWEDDMCSSSQTIHYEDGNEKLLRSEGAIRLVNGNNDVEYYSYNYTRPENYEELSNMTISPSTGDVQNGYFYGKTGTVINIDGQPNSVIKNVDFIKSGTGVNLYSWKTIKDIKANFIDNGVPITMQTSYINGNGAIQGNFINNSSLQFMGGWGSSQVNFIFSNFIGNRNGAVSNGNSNNREIISNFIGNYSINTEDLARAGALYNYGVIGNLESLFISNFTIGNTYSHGGALYNTGTIGNTWSLGKAFGITNSDFYWNRAISEDGTAQGGAIYNTGTIGRAEINGGILNSNFYGNYAKSVSGTAQGGAIWTNKSLNIIADNSTSTFQGNYVQVGDEKDDQAIWIDSADATLTLDTKNNGEIFMYDNINGADGYKVNITGDNTGTMHLYNDINNGDITVSNTTLDISDSAVNMKNVTFTEDSTLALKVNALNDHGSVTAENITVKEGAKLKASLAQGIVGSGKQETLQLLKADNTDFNNFADEFDNNMYEFEKADKNGAYNIKLVKTAEEVAEETGAEQWAADIAGAYVDGASFDAGTVAADVANKLANLAQNDAAELVKAIKALAPTETAVVEDTGIAQASRLSQNVTSHLGGNDGPMGFASGDELDGVSIWAKAYVGEAKINKRGKVAGSESDSRGVIMGVEKKLDNSKKVGVGFQYDDTDIDALSRDIDVATLSGFVYGEYKPSRWFVNGVAAYGQSDYKEKKFALGSKYTADYDVHIASLAAMTGYQFKYFTPEAGMRYYHIKQDGYTDSAGQSVGAQNTDILRAALGTRVAKDFGRFRPEVYAGLTYDLMAGEHDTTVNLANGASYTVPGKRLARLGYEASAGLSATITDNITASLSYLGAYRRDYQEHTGMFNVKYNF